MSLIKHFEGGIKDVDEKGVVTFYFSAFNNFDSDNDRTMPGAFLKTMRENSDRVRHFKNHDSRLACGVIQEMGEDTFGAWARSQLILGTQTGRDTYEEYKVKAIKEHSFGYDYVKYSDEKDPDNPWSRRRTVTEYKLWEVSSLTSWGANELTAVIDIKNEKAVNDYLDVLLKLQKGQFTDEYLSSVEAKISDCLKYLQTLKTTTLNVTCEKCHTIFDYMSQPEAGMGYVKCPKCGASVNQKGIQKPGDEPFDGFTYLKNNLKILN